VRRDAERARRLQQAILGRLGPEAAAVGPYAPEAGGVLHGLLAGGRGLVVRDERQQDGRNLCLELVELPRRDWTARPRPGALLRTPATAVVLHVHQRGAAAAPAWWWTALVRGSLGPTGEPPAFQGWRWRFVGEQRTGAWAYLVSWGRLLLPRDPAGVALVPASGDAAADGAEAVRACLRTLAGLPASTRTAAERHRDTFSAVVGALRA
jgi:hypothetical protein